MAITETQDPTSLLASPVSQQGDVGEKLRKDAGFLIGSLDGVVEFLFGFSPLTEWIAKPITGDWDAIDRGGQAWKNLGLAITASSENLRSVPGQIGERWDGTESSDSFRKEVTGAADKFANYEAGCTAMAELCATMIEVCKAVADVIGAILKMINDLITQLLVIMAIPAIGQAAAAARIAAATPRVLNWVKLVADALEKLYAAAQNFVKGYNANKQLLGILKTLATAIKVGAGANSNGAGTQARVEAAFA